MSHHPLHVLQEFDRRAVQARIERTCHFLHCGHLHNPDQRLGGGDRANSCLVLASGASFETRHTRNSYAIVTLDLLRAVRSVTTVHYNRHDVTFSETAQAQFPIEIQLSGACAVADLAAAIAAFDPALASWPHYFAALLLDQKAEVPVPTASGYAFGSFAVIEAGPDGELKERTATFKAFRNALRVLYPGVPLADIFRRHGAAVAQYGETLNRLSEAHATVKTRLDALEQDTLALATIEPRESFSHTTAMLKEIADTGDWDLLREQAERHIDSPSQPIALAARRMLALACGSGTERAEKERAVSLYHQLAESDAFEQTDFGNLAMLLAEIGQPGNAQDVVLRGIATCTRLATGYWAEVGHRIVETTGDRGFRTRLEAAIAEKGDRESRK